MIVIRRLFALLLIPVFLCLFLVTLLAVHVNETFLKPGFYTETLLDVENVNFIYDEGIPYALSEAQKNGGFSTDGLPFGIHLSPHEISLQLRTVLPPDWLVNNLTAVITDILPYLTGEADGFQIIVAIDDRMEAASLVLTDLLLRSAIHDYLLSDVVMNQVDKSSALENLPFGITITSQQMVQGVIEVLPEAWLKEQMVKVIDEITPYLLGRTDTFAITIPLQDQAETAINVIEGWVLTSLAEDGSFEYLLQEQIASAVQTTLGPRTELPYGVKFTDEEIVTAIREILSMDKNWLSARVEDVVESVGPYLVGRSDSFVVVIPLADLAAAAVPVLVDVADSKFEEIYTGLQVCSVTEMLSLSLSLDSLPPCRPQLLPYSLLKAVVGLDVLEEVVAAVVEPLPTSIELTDEQLLTPLGSHLPMPVDDLREILRGGYTFTQESLDILLRSQPSDPKTGEDYIALLDGIRMWMRDGLSLDEVTLRQEILQWTGKDSLVSAFDNTRGAISTARENTVLLLLLPGVIALIIGWLGGRHWGSRLTWTGTPLLLSGVIATIGLGPVAEFGFAKLDGLIRNLNLSSILIEQILDVRLAIELSFVAPMASDAMTAAVAGAVMVVLGLMLGRLGRSEIRVPEKNAAAWQTTRDRDAHGAIDLLNDERASEN
jgi:hypothetical protein